MTSTASGLLGPSFGWLNREVIAARKKQPHMTVFGGEDRFWLGPEGGQYALYFPPGAPFDRASKYHLLLNLAVGGNWAGKVNATGIDEAAFPQGMLVDYVRVYRCSAGLPDGRGCATVGANAKLVQPEPAQRRPALDPASR